MVWGIREGAGGGNHCQSAAWSGNEMVTKTRKLFSTPTHSMDCVSIGHHILVSVAQTIDTIHAPYIVSIVLGRIVSMLKQLPAD